MSTQNNEFEVMHQQLAILSKKLEGQQIINERLMREAMKNKMSWIKKFVWTEILLVPLLICFFFIIAMTAGLSLGPVIYITVMLIASVISDYKINMIRDKEFLDGNLTDTATKLIKMKKQRLINEMIFTPFLLIWLVWFLYDLYLHIPAEGIWNSALTGGLIGGCIGTVAGVVIAITLILKMQRTNDEVIRQIQELTKDEPLS